LRSLYQSTKIRLVSFEFSAFVIYRHFSRTLLLNALLTMAAAPGLSPPTIATKITANTRVSFDREKNLIHEIPHHKEMSSKERKELWLEPQEYWDIVAATRLTVAEMQRRLHGNNTSPTTSLSSHKNKKGKKGRNEEEEEDLYCFRGVEELIQELALRREMAIIQSVDAVTKEQAEQRRQKQQQVPYSLENGDDGGRTVQEVKDYDGAERIAQAYMVFTQSSSQRAQDMGLADEAEVLRLATLSSSSSSSSSSAANFEKRSSSSFSNGKNPARRLSGLVKQVVQIVRFR
jgi:hypothetical protein